MQERFLTREICLLSMYDFRQIIFALIIGILISIFAFSSIEAIYPSPEYDCTYPRPKLINEQTYQENPAEIEKYNACQEAYDAKQQLYEFVVFVTTTVLGILAIIVGLLLTPDSAFKTVVANGLLLAGLLVLFFGTMRGWGSLASRLKPVIILIEIVIVLVVAWRKMDNVKKPKKN